MTTLFDELCDEIDLPGLVAEMVNKGLKKQDKSFIEPDEMSQTILLRLLNNINKNEIVMR